MSAVRLYWATAVRVDVRAEFDPAGHERGGLPGRGRRPADRLTGAAAFDIR